MKIQRGWIRVVLMVSLLATAFSLRAQSGNTKDEAITLGVLNKELITASGEISNARPKIYYKFEITEKVREVAVSLSGGTGALNVYLQRDANADGVLENLTSGRISAASGALTKLWLGPGAYYVWVDQSSATAFQLTIASVVKESRGETDNLHSVSVDLGETLQPLSFQDWVGASDMADWYKFEVKETTREVNVGLSGGTGTLDVYLQRDADGDRVLENLTSGRISAASGALTKLWLDPGIYYVLVDGNSWTEYQLNVTSTPKQTRGESDNRHSVAVDLGEALQPLTFRDWVGVSDSADWYKFEIKTSTRDVAVGLSGGTGTLDVYLQRDADGDGVLENLTSGRISAASGALTKLWLNPGVYYVLVDANSWTEYELNVTSTPKPTLGETDNRFSAAKDLGEALQTLTFGDWVGASDPSDWYKFEIKTTTRDVAVGLSGGAGTLDVYLQRDADGDGVLENLTSGRISAASGALTKLWLDPGIYYVLVDANSWTEYQLNITSTPKQTRGETDNRPQSAVDLGPVRSPLSYTDWVGVSDARDYYRFQVTGTKREVVVGVSEGDGTLDVYLQRDSNGDGVLDNIHSGRISATSGSLGKRELDPGVYFVLVAANSWTEYRLTINQNLLPNTKPFIEVHPVGQTITEGKTAILSVFAEGSGVLSYQWFLNGQALQGQNQAELILTSVPTSAAGSYTVKVANEFGEIISSAGELAVNPAGFELNIDRAVILSWPVSAGDVVLEGSDTPELRDSWKPVPFQALIVGDRKEVSVRTLAAMKTYRLRKAE